MTTMSRVESFVFEESAVLERPRRKEKIMLQPPETEMRIFPLRDQRSGTAPENISERP